MPERSTVAGAIVCTELTTGAPWPGMPEFIARAAAAHAGVRILGSAALAVVQVALGHAAAVVLHSVHEWDVAGGIALALESGALVSDRHGGPSPLLGNGLLVAAPGVAHEVLGWWREATAQL